MMKSKELKTKISHTLILSLILSLARSLSLKDFSFSDSLSDSLSRSLSLSLREANLMVLWAVSAVVSECCVCSCLQKIVSTFG